MENKYYYFKYNNNSISELLINEKCYYYYAGNECFVYIAHNLSSDILVLLALKGIDVEEINDTTFDIIRMGAMEPLTIWNPI